MPVKTRVMTIWTIGNRPFVMGGSVEYPMGTKTKCVGAYHVGKGYNVFIANGPAGQVAVVESKSGAVVGSSIDQVRQDVATGDPALMKQQVRAALEQVNKVELIPESEWWQARSKAISRSESQTSSSGPSGGRSTSDHSSPPERSPSPGCKKPRRSVSRVA